MWRMTCEAWPASSIKSWETTGPWQIFFDRKKSMKRIRLAEKCLDTLRF